MAQNDAIKNKKSKILAIGKIKLLFSLMGDHHPEMFFKINN